MILICMSLFVSFLARMILLSSRRSRPRVTALGIIGLCCCCLGTTSRTIAQEIGGSISGTVKDKQGGAISDVTAIFTNTKTGVTTTVHTNRDGLYRGSNLQPGVYDLKVTFAGFSTGIKNNITLNVGADLTVDFDLKVASLDQNITVTGSEASVDLSTSSLSYDVPGPTIRELPVKWPRLYLACHVAAWSVGDQWCASWFSAYGPWPRTYYLRPTSCSQQFSAGWYQS